MNFSVLATPAIDGKGKLSIKLTEVDAKSDSFEVTMDKPEDNSHLSKLK